MDPRALGKKKKILVCATNRTTVLRSSGLLCSHNTDSGTSSPKVANVRNMSLNYDESVTTQNLAFLSYWFRKKRLQMRFQRV